MTPTLDEAAVLLGCRRAATAREVRAAYRATVRSGRPDTGRSDGLWLTRVQAARDLLLAQAAPDRRRRERVRGTPAGVVGLRRSTWEPDAPQEPQVDLRL